MSTWMPYKNAREETEARHETVKRRISTLETERKNKEAELNELDAEIADMRAMSASYQDFLSR